MTPEHFSTAVYIFGGNLFIAVDMMSYIYSSVDGYTWITNTGPSLVGDSQYIIYARGAFLATGGYGGAPIWESEMFYTNTSPPPTTLGISTYAGVTINGTVGGVYQIQYNTSLNTNWQTITNIQLPYSPYLWIDTSTTVTGQRFYQSVQLQ